MKKLSERLLYLKILDSISIEENENYYIIRLKFPIEKNHPIKVVIGKKDNTISYRLSDTTDCYEYDMEINMVDFNRLQNYVKELIK